VSSRQFWRPPVVGDRCMGSHGPGRGGLSERQSSGHLEHGPGVPEGHSLAEWRLCMPVDHQLVRF
jgi:hypothetical protein